MALASSQFPLFYVVFDRIVPAANKYMATLFNTSSTNVIMIDRIFRFSWQFAGAPDAELDQYLARITARTAGTSVTVHRGDTIDTIPSGIAADTDSMIVTEDHIIRRVPATSAEFQVSATLKNLMAFESNAGVIYERLSDYQGIILRQNEGLSIRNVTAVTTGSVSYVFEFTQVFI